MHKKKRKKRVSSGKPEPVKSRHPSFAQTSNQSSSNIIFWANQTMNLVFPLLFSSTLSLGEPRTTHECEGCTMVCTMRLGAIQLLAASAPARAFLSSSAPSFLGFGSGLSVFHSSRQGTDRFSPFAIELEVGAYVLVQQQSLCNQYESSVGCMQVQYFSYRSRHLRHA